MPAIRPAARPLPLARRAAARAGGARPSRYDYAAVAGPSAPWPPGSPGPRAAPAATFAFPFAFPTGSRHGAFPRAHGLAGTSDRPRTPHDARTAPTQIPPRPPVHPRLCRTDLAVAPPGCAAHLDEHRHARRQPGPDRTDGRRAQTALLRTAGRRGPEGNRSCFPIGLGHGLQLRAPAHRGRTHSRRRHHRGADPIAARSDRTHL